MAPFDAKKLNRLMEEAGLRLLLACTRHNVRYLTGGYYYHFLARAPRFGRTQYLPFVGLPRGRFDEAFYVGRVDERSQIETEGLWISQRIATQLGTVNAAEGVIQAARQLGITEGTVKCHVTMILSRLGVSDRTQAVVAAAHRGIVHLD